MAPRKLLFVSMHYQPEPCDTRTSVLARELSRAGHSCTVLTSFPNYPFGKVYEGYRQRPWMRQEHDGVRVLRVPMFPDHSKSVRRRALSYASFGASASLLGPGLIGKPDLVWIHHPPVTTGLAGWWLSKLKRVPFVYEIHDLWPETLMSTGMVGESSVTRAIRRTCDFLHRNAAAVTVTSQGMKAHLESQGLEPDKVHVVPQWADESAQAPVRRDSEFGLRHGLAGRFNIVFTGNIGAAQGVDSVLTAAALLSDLPDVQFVFVGAGVELERLRERASAMRLHNVRFLGHIAKSEVGDFLSWGDALLVTLKNDPLFSITVPSKTQTYLFAGRPILCGVAGDTAEIVAQSRSGLTFEPEDSQGLERTVRTLYAMPEDERRRMGRNARAAYDAGFSIGRSVQVYQELFDAVIDPVVESGEDGRTEFSKAA